MNESVLDWSTANQALLAAELAWLRHGLEQQIDDGQEGGGSVSERGPALARAVDDARNAMPAPAAIDIVAELFGLSDFERLVLLLCCGAELDAHIADACARLHGNAAARNASFGLALANLPEAHWSALTPSRPLRHWRLVEVDAGLRLVDSPLRVDERVLHFIAGINALDARLRPLLTLREPPRLIAASHEDLSKDIVARLLNSPHAAGLVHFDGDDLYGQQDLAASVAATLGSRLYTLRGEDLPGASNELDQLQVLWERESRLLPAVLLLQVSDSTATNVMASFVENLRAPLFVSSREPLRVQRASWTFTVDKPDAVEQKTLWRQALGARAGRLNGALDALSGQFRLSAQTIATIAESESDLDIDGHHAVWHAARRIGRERLEDLAERINPVAQWDDLILPAAQTGTLRQIAAHLRQRMRVYEDWGFARSSTRGLGVSALFCGESGTGKTLAAEVLANELSLDLYRIDLSSVVSKYIGETEKNLRRVFDAAEDSGAILLFDEADALFGKRSEVKDSHDRYANIEISYLLQRMEAYRGLAVLTTNMKAALDRAFQRRLRFILNFPFPDSELREAIWRRVFPSQVPLSGIDYRKLAKLNLPGGNIRNIALNSAFLAADAGEPLGMAHLLRAAQSESAKLERPLADVETRGWI
ncbi:ATP-binding protein [Lysobacter yangpyeongensis]|uniref:ATP-binding protein n=1 Tax=Lysobacter yangpyeongensis TaxID=346182 RepID=A0ABW0SJM4_9GAMM